MFPTYLFYSFLSNIKIKKNTFNFVFVSNALVNVRCACVKKLTVDMFDVSNGFNGINVCGDTNWSYLFIDVINDAGDSDIKKKKKLFRKIWKKND